MTDRACRTTPSGTIDQDGPVTNDRAFGRLPDGRDVRLLTIGSVSALEWRCGARQ